MQNNQDTYQQGSRKAQSKCSSLRLSFQCRCDKRTNKNLKI